VREYDIPIANGAADGPLAMLSPSNTRVGLTHTAPGTASGEPARYYPSGTRNYARIVPAEDAQARALAKMAGTLGARRVAIISDGEQYGDALAAMLAAAARREGLRVASRGRWDPHAQRFEGLARRVAGERPDAVLLSGLWQLNGVALAGALRGSLDPGTPLLATDGFASLPDSATGAALGLYVASPGLPPQRMRSGGREIVRRFGAGQLPGLGPPYAAQAAEALLAAIARSDGTRRSVVRTLLGGRVEGGVLGPIRFDRDGDIVVKPISIYRVRRGGLSLARVIVS